MGIDDAGLHKAFANRGCNTQMKNKNSRHIEEGRKHHRCAWLENAGGHHGGYRICRIMKTIHEIEGKGQKNQQYHHPEGCLCVVHRHRARSIRSSRG